MAALDNSRLASDRRRISPSAIARTVLVLLILLGLLSCTDPKQNSGEGSLTLYTTELAAQQHCPKDTVVWLNLPTGIYHFQGQRWYSNTKNGAFVCEKEAD
jgi:hypothetical protein